MNLLAQGQTNLGPIRGLGPLGGSTPNTSPIIFNTIISIVIGVLTMIASIWFIILLITGAISWMGAGGDKVAIENAKKKILNGLIGLTIVISSLFIIEIIGKLLGLPFIINPANFIYNVSNVSP